MMVARAAEWNVSIFRKEGLLPPTEVAKAFLHYAVKYNSHYANAKYCLAQVMRTHLESQEGKKLLSAHSLKDIWYVSFRSINSSDDFCLLTEEILFKYNNCI